ncbi:hypothetical protein Pdw03_5694 [Penicillium digitatum]|uniref:Uncharacterized protein n=1 Tax=Penicillium digitatum TaxID=36651 RepID=A0A7T6XVB9_PENDI|nr:hypothetical protein Pdw03_5694 [Penicillium digitatum]
MRYIVRLDVLSNSAKREAPIGATLASLRETRSTDELAGTAVDTRSFGLQLCQGTVSYLYRFKPAWSEAFPEKLHALLKKSGITSRETVCKRCRIFWAIFEILCKDHCWCGCNWQHTMESRAMQITMHEEMRSMHSTLKDTISPATAKSVF